MDYYKIEWKTSAKKELKQLSKPLITKIVQEVNALTENPFPRNSKKLVGSQTTYRLRIGNYRVIYQIYSNRLIIEIVKVGHRQNVYK